jgi:hypothetical protein
LAYAAEFLPAVIVWPIPMCQTICVSGQPVRFERGSAPVWGVGLTPLGLEGRLRVHPRWAILGAGGLGFIQFTRAVPVAGSRALNYTVEYGGGVLWRFRAQQWLQLGFKFHHLSNLYTAPLNPGLDANVLYLAWSYRLRIKP